ncbi:MAG: hypothetical protein DRJ03_09775 [Chloroflexi bacterium]|nr:MAG: hypothetical protein DRJ03_09775 [Chloroflexota bacterium]
MPFKLRGAQREPGEVLSLGELVPAIRVLELEGFIEEEPTEEPYSREYVVALRDFKLGGEQVTWGQYVETARIPDLDRLLEAGFVFRVRESEPFRKGQSFKCLDPNCNAFFCSVEARRHHQQLMGHRRNYPEHISHKRRKQTGKKKAKGA